MQTRLRDGCEGRKTLPVLEANPGSAGILPAFSLLKHAAKMAALPGIVKARKISDAHVLKTEAFLRLTANKHCAIMGHKHARWLSQPGSRLFGVLTRQQ